MIMQPLSKIRGVYRRKIEETGEEWVFVDYAVGGKFEITRARYDQRMYEPAFEDLPTIANYEAALKTETEKV